MHVVHVYDGHERVHGGRGSVPNVVWNTARETAAQGHDVTVLERQWHGLDRQAEHDGVRFERLALRTGSTEPWEEVPYELVETPGGVVRLVVDRTNFALGALRRLRSIGADIIHVHLPFASNVLLLVAPWLRTRTVYTAHLGELRMNALTDAQQKNDAGGATKNTDTTSSTSSRAHATAERMLDVPDVLRYLSPDAMLAKRVAHTTVLNAAIESVFLERGVPATQVSVVPNGVDYRRFSEVSSRRIADVRESYDIRDGPVLLFVGTVMPRKGVDDLVRAMGALVNDSDFEDLQVVIAGEDDLDGEYTATVRELAREAGVDDAVTFAGFVPDDDLPALYALADVFVLPSREEGFGMAVLEAMAAGTPVVATDVGGVSRVVTEGEQGYLVQPNDPDGIVMYVKKILTLNDEVGQFEVRTRDRAREYTWPEIASRFVSVYEKITRSEGT